MAVVMTDLVGALWLRYDVRGWWLLVVSGELPVGGVMGEVIARAVLRGM